MPSKPHLSAKSKSEASPKQRAQRARIMASVQNDAKAVSIDVDPKRINVAESPYTEYKATMQRVKLAATKALSNGERNNPKPIEATPPGKRGRGRPRKKPEDLLCNVATTVSIVREDFNEMTRAIESGEVKSSQEWIRNRLKIARNYLKTMG